MPTSKLRFVFDTNVIVSALIMKQSTARRAFDKAADVGKLLLSPAILEEFIDVLSRSAFDKYITTDERLQFLAALVRESDLIEDVGAITECRDPKDNKYLEAAIAGKAACIVSGDNDLLVLDPFRDISILSPRAFLDNFDLNPKKRLAALGGAMPDLEVPPRRRPD